MDTEPRWAFEYKAKLRKQWQSSRKLTKKWYEEHPFFHPADYRSAQHQYAYHFFEWYAAVLIYEETGWYSLVEKYDFKSHPRKRRILNELLTEEQIRALDRERRPCQCPDLLAYKPNLSDFYFCEVKGPRDRLRPVQKRFFNRLERNVGKPVCVAEFREV